MEILREFEENGYKVTEYTRDGKTVAARVEEKIMDPSELPPVEVLPPQPTAEEMQAQTLLNTEYLVVMSELTNI